MSALIDWKRRHEIVVAENQRLRLRIDTLEETLGLTTPEPPDLLLTASEASVLRLLIARGLVRHEAIMTLLYSDRAETDIPGSNVAGIWICKLRRKLSAFGIAIETRWGEGYFLSPAARETIRSMPQIKGAAA